MAINYEALMNYRPAPVNVTYTRRDTMFYALSIGIGMDLADPGQLQYVYEKNLTALPTMAIILGYPGPWHATLNTGITRSHVVHGEQGFVIHKPLPVEGVITGKTRLKAVLDKGADKGALLLTETEVRSKTGGELICTLTSTTFCREDGGFGGPAKLPRPVVMRLNSAIIKAINQPSVQERFTADKIVGTGSTPEEFGERIRADYELALKVVKDAKIPLSD